MTGTTTVAELLAEIETLRRRLQEAEETLTISPGGRGFNGAGDSQAYVPLYELTDPYQVLIEHMPHRAAILRPDGVFLYGNCLLAESLGVDPAKLAGAALTELVPAEQAAVCQECLCERTAGASRCDVDLLHSDGQRMPVRLTFNPVAINGQRLVALLVNDLSEQQARQRAEQLAERLEREIQRRIEVEQALRTSEERYRSFVRQASEGVWRFEFEQPIPIDLPADEQLERGLRSGYLAECNDAMARMYGYETAEQLAGRRLSELLVTTDANNLERLRQFFLRGYRLTDTESIEQDRDGKIRIFLNNFVGTVENGCLVRVWGTQRDITERKRAEESLRDADRRKDQFLAMLAHELRNPLGPLRNAVQILRLTDSHSEAAHQARDMMDRQVGHMARLIDDLLDVSRIARGKILLRKERCDLIEIVRTTVEDYRGILEATGLQLSVELAAGPLWVDGDRTRLSQIVGNLLHNANKFTDAGGTVSVGLRVDLDSQAASLSVRDTGIGIDPSAIGEIFEPFSQAERSLDHSRGGLGLGLTLVKGLVELHGGRVWAQSEGPGKGAEFLVTLPLADLSQRGTQGALPETPAPLRVLVVEDHADSAESMRILLSLSGHQVKVAHDGLTALDVAESFRPDVVICDVGLPGGLDGYEVARSLRLDPAQAETFLIALTGYGQEDDRELALEAGFDWYLTKPVDFEALCAVLAAAPLRNSARA